MVGNLSYVRGQPLYQATERQGNTNTDLADAGGWDTDTAACK